MEKPKPYFPPNYVTLKQLHDRRLKDQHHADHRHREEEEEEEARRRKLQRERDENRLPQRRLVHPPPDHNPNIVVAAASEIIAPGGGVEVSVAVSDVKEKGKAESEVVENLNVDGGDGVAAARRGSKRGRGRGRGSGGLCCRPVAGSVTSGETDGVERNVEVVGRGRGWGRRGRGRGAVGSAPSAGSETERGNVVVTGRGRGRGRGRMGGRGSWRVTADPLSGAGSETERAVKVDEDLKVNGGNEMQGEGYVLVSGQGNPVLLERGNVVVTDRGKGKIGGRGRQRVIAGSPPGAGSEKGSVKSEIQGAGNAAVSGKGDAVVLEGGNAGVSNRGKRWVARRRRGNGTASLSGAGSETESAVELVGDLKASRNETHGAVVSDSGNTMLLERGNPVISKRGKGRMAGWGRRGVTVCFVPDVGSETQGVVGVLEELKLSRDNETQEVQNRGRRQNARKASWSVTTAGPLPIVEGLAVTGDNDSQVKGDVFVAVRGKTLLSGRGRGWKADPLPIDRSEPDHAVEVVENLMLSGENETPKRLMTGRGRRWNSRFQGFSRRVTAGSRPVEGMVWVKKTIS